MKIALPNYRWFVGNKPVDGFVHAVLLGLLHPVKEGVL